MKKWTFKKMDNFQTVNIIYAIVIVLIFSLKISPFSKLNSAKFIHFGYNFLLGFLILIEIRHVSKWVPIIIYSLFVLLFIYTKINNIDLSGLDIWNYMGAIIFFIFYEFIKNLAIFQEFSNGLYKTYKMQKSFWLKASSLVLALALIYISILL